jgi:hypothetical protein
MKLFLSRFKEIKMVKFFYDKRGLKSENTKKIGWVIFPLFIRLQSIQN